MRSLVLLLLLLCAGCAAPSAEQRQADYLAELNRDRAELGHPPLKKIPRAPDAPNLFLLYHIWYQYNPSLRYER